MGGPRSARGPEKGAWLPRPSFSSSFPGTAENRGGAEPPPQTPAGSQFSGGRGGRGCLTSSVTCCRHRSPPGGQAGRLDGKGSSTRPPGGRGPRSAGRPLGVLPPGGLELLLPLCFANVQRFSLGVLGRRAIGCGREQKTGGGMWALCDITVGSWRKE